MKVKILAGLAALLALLLLAPPANARDRAATVAQPVQETVYLQLSGMT